MEVSEIMKISRLIGIIAMLQQRQSVTIAYLAEKFEVSRRTISRDIEDICKAGIPIVTTQGHGGGVALMAGFALDTTVFTEQELAAIFTGLKTLDSVSTSSSAKRVAQKIGGETVGSISDGMMIDLSSFYKKDLAYKIEQIQRAIREKRVITFHYCYEKGESDKVVEPYRIVFKWSSWYIFGFCRERQDFRLYKLRRLWDLCVTDGSFTPREVPEQKEQFGSHLTDDYIVTAIYDASVKYRLVEEYGPNSFTVMEDGRLHTQWGYTSLEEILRWILSFGDKVTVEDPPELIARIRAEAEKICRKYREDEDGN